MVENRLRWAERVDSLLDVKRKSCSGACDLLGDGGGDVEKGIDLSAVEGLIVFEHTEDGVEELAHRGDEGLEFGFAAGQEVVVESAQMILMPDGD